MSRTLFSINSTMAWNSSYVFGHDNVSGWGDRYFFTYYSEFGQRSVAAIASEVSVFLIILILSVFANVSIAVCVMRWVLVFLIKLGLSQVWNYKISSRYVFAINFGIYLMLRNMYTTLWFKGVRNTKLGACSSASINKLLRDFLQILKEEQICKKNCRQIGTLIGGKFFFTV